LKIDILFVSKRELESNNASIVKAIIVLGKSLNMCIVAEGVETAFQYELLKSLQFDYYQGYLFSKPIAGHTFEKLISGTSLKSA